MNVVVIIIVLGDRLSLINVLILITIIMVNIATIAILRIHFTMLNMIMYFPTIIFRLAITIPKIDNILIDSQNTIASSISLIMVPIITIVGIITLIIVYIMLMRSVLWVEGTAMLSNHLDWVTAFRTIQPSLIRNWLRV